MKIFSINYFLFFTILLVTEILVGAFVHDTIVRPYVGDLLAVILIYCFIKSFMRTGVAKACIAALLFAYAVEVSQYFKLVVVLGLKNSAAARIILGDSFSWTDMLMYTLGIAITATIEKLLPAKRKQALHQQQKQAGWIILWQKKV
ncbi:MAG TPA: DUF2809 domain-containing protein [Chitinophagaceae bacterium]|nr:DUF2809 domain-containing protein [Chitinophagaceae bacterium]